MKVEKNCRVRLNYTISLQEGQIVDKNPEDQPLEITTGKNQVIPVLEGVLKEQADGLDELRAKIVSLEAEVLKLGQFIAVPDPMRPR